MGQEEIESFREVGVLEWIYYVPPESYDLYVLMEGTETHHLPRP